MSEALAASLKKYEGLTALGIELNWNRVCEFLKRYDRKCPGGHDYMEQLAGEIGCDIDLLRKCVKELTPEDAERGDREATKYWEEFPVLATMRPLLVCPVKGCEMPTINAHGHLFHMQLVHNWGAQEALYFARRMQKDDATRKR
jgi:hypothetical protein